MKAYLIDEITPPDMKKVIGFIEKNTIKSHIDQIFWVQIPDVFLSDIQLENHHCQPHVFSVEFGSDWVKLEFFVRTLKDMNCTCLGYCSAEQRDYHPFFPRHDRTARHQNLKRPFLFFDKDFSDLLLNGH